MHLNDMLPEELQEAFAANGEPAYRAGQLFSWFARGVTAFLEMTDLSAALKERLAQRYTVAPVSIEQKFVSAIDGTVKYLLRLGDGHVIESVAMRYKHGISVCISTEVGCPMGCRFCASTLGGKVRNLSAGEILGQAAAVQRDLGARISNIVLMGIGEPLDNYDNVVRFLRLVNHEKGMNIGFRHISLSTCGLADGIDRLAQERLPITLSVSLHAPDDETRNRIMPVNRRFNVARLLRSCRAYQQAAGRRISFEYILIDGVNDSDRHAELLAARLQGMMSHVNLIPANFVAESGLRKSPPARVRAFLERLGRLGVNATVRRELGGDIAASCGQLRKRHLDR